MTDISLRFSLLYADPDQPAEALYSAETLDFIGDLPCEDPLLLRRILGRKTSRRDILFRKEILEDFLRAPSLLTCAEGISRRWEALSETALREQTPAGDCSWEEGLECLKNNAVSLSEHLRFLLLSYGDFQRQTPESGGLFAFSEYLRRQATAPEVSELLEQASRIPLLRPGDVKAVLHLNLDRYGAVASADCSYLGPDDGKYLKKHPPRRDGLSVNLPKEHLPDLTAGALRRLCAAFRGLTAGIRAAFEPLQEGLAFYRFALSLVEWARSKGYGWRFASPVAPHGPVGRGIRNLAEWADGTYRPPLTCSARALEAYRGEWGSEMLKIIARTQIFSSAGLPVVAEDLVFCPEERITVYDSAGKTVESEIEALADLYRQTRRGDVILLNQPLITVGKTPAAEIMGNLLRAFHKKGAAVRLATDLTVD